MNYFGKKTFLLVRFTTASGAIFGENFLLLKLIAEHPLTTSFPPFFVISVSTCFWTLSAGEYAGIRIILPGKKYGPHPDSADELVFQP